MRRIIDFYVNNFKKIVFLQVVFCIVLFIAINCLSRNEREVNFSKSDLAGGIISEEGFACIDENDGVYGIVLDTTTEEVKRGWYKVRIEYETGYDDNGFIVQALRPGNVLNEDIGNEERTVSLKSYHNSQEVHAWLKKDSELRVAVHFCGGGYLQVKRIILQQIPNYTAAFLLIFCLLSANIELYEMGNFSASEVRRRRYIRGGIAVIVLLGSIPLINDFNIHGHDYRGHLYRIEGIAEGLRAGQFPVKIYPNWWNEYGYGQAVFYGDILLYFPALLTLLGYGIQTAYKSYIIGINFLTAGIAYKCFRKISEDDKIALSGAFLYTLNIYRLIDVYVRCALGEYTAIAFFPLIILGIYLIEKEGWVYLALGLSGCIQSHVLSCEIVIIFLVLFCLFKIKWILKRKVLFQFCKAGIATILWNIWFILPFLDFYLRGTYKIHFMENAWKMEDRGVPFRTIFKIFFEGSKEDNFTVGLPLVLCGILGCILLVIYRKRSVLDKRAGKLKKLTCICLLMMAIAMALSTNLVPYSKMADIHVKIGKLISTLQFPYRFMGIASVLAVTTLVGASALLKIIAEEYEEKRVKILEGAVAGGLIILVIAGATISYRKLLENCNFTQNFEYYAADYVMQETEYLPINADESKTGHELLTSTGNIVISDYEKEYTNIVMTCINSGEKEGYIDVPLFYYPCYKARDKENGEILSLTYGENSRIRIILPPSYEGTIVLRISERKGWRIAELISIFSIIMGVYIAAKKRWTRDNKGKQNI